MASLLDKPLKGWAEISLLTLWSWVCIHHMKIPFVVPSQVGLCRRLHHFEGTGEVHHRNGEFGAQPGTSQLLGLLPS